MLEAMSHRGPDGRDMLLSDNVALGHLRFWTTPEECGERQPLQDRESLSLVWDGRIDNRAELYELIPRQQALNPTELSDAQLLLLGYRHAGLRMLSRLLGSFAFALYDSGADELLAGRDAMGNRSVFYQVLGPLVLVASEEAGLLAHPAVKVLPNERSLAEFFAGCHGGREHSAFRDIQLLGAGQLLRVRRQSQAVNRFASVKLGEALTYRDPREYQEHFVHLLDQSVRDRLRGTGGIGVTLSGGLDSAPIAALASRQSNDPVCALSWVFDQYPACDERRYFESLYPRYRLAPLQINCDDAWPLSGLDSYRVHPTVPAQDAYREFHQRTYRAARQTGVKVLLSGMLGDLLYTGLDRWLYDLARETGLREAMREAGNYRRAHGLALLVKSQLLKPLLPAAIRTRLGRHREAPWLTDYARRLLGHRSSPDGVKVRRPGQYARIFDPLNARELYIESYFSHRQGVEVRYPLRDQRLVEYMLQVPVNQLFSMDMTRPIVREGLQGVLPEPILTRGGKTSFEPLFRAGFEGHAKNHVDRILADERSSWSRFIDPNWLRAGDNRDPRRYMVLWFCVSLGLWLDKSVYGAELKEGLLSYA